MRRLILRFGIALLTFIVGVSITWLYLLPLQRSSNSIITPPMRPAAQLSGEVQIRFQRFEETEYGSYAEFRVINGTSEPLRYLGLSKNHNTSDEIIVGSRVKETPSFSCGTGLEERTLLSGESVTYHVDVSDWTGRVRVGFDFLVGQMRHRETILSDEFTIPSP